METKFKSIESLTEIMDRLKRYENALIEITQGKGRFSMDDLTHARNTIEDMKQIAINALYPDLEE